MIEAPVITAMTVVKDAPSFGVVVAIAVLIGVVIGMIIIISTIFLMQQKSANDKPQTPKPRQLLSPRRHRKQSEKRAADIALAKVAGLAVEGPTRR